MLKLVAPASMTADAQMVWLQAAVDALEDIRASEVQAISAELRRSVTHYSKIVPEIARLVAEKRQRVARPQATAEEAKEWEITREAQRKRGSARSQAEVDAAWRWEREARIEAGLHVRPLQPPLSAREIGKLTPAMKRMGLKCGALVERNGELIDTAA